MYKAVEALEHGVVEWKCTVQLASDWQSSNCQTALLTLSTSYKQPTSLSLFLTEITCTELNRVCEVNNEGNIVTSYGGSRGSGLGQLDAPVHIVLDSEERVLVADSGNRRVLLLSRQLDIQRVLLSWSRDFPWRLHYDKDTTQLMVGMESGRVEIYRLQWNFMAMDQSSDSAHKIFNQWHCAVMSSHEYSTKNRVFDPPPSTCVHMGLTPPPLWTSTCRRDLKCVSIYQNGSQWPTVSM